VRCVSIQLCMVAGVTNRLSAADWIDAGLKALSRQGLPSLRADLLAKALGVSRGSFYWHFADLDAYKQQVINRWLDVATQAIIDEIEAIDPDAGRLRALLQRALTASTSLEIGMRSWAASDGKAAAAVALVDRKRRAYLVRLLVAAGHKRQLADTRADILYWAYLGCALSGRKPKGQPLERLINELASFGDAPHRA